MKPVYLCEEKQYHINDLENILHSVCITTDVSKLVKDMQECHLVCKIESKSDVYKFTCVGITIFNDFVFMVYPKYLKSFETYNKSKQQDEIKFILQAIRRYRKDYSIYKDSEEQITSGEADGILGIILFIIDDYYMNGVYTNYKDIVKVGDPERIDWDRTINDGTPYMIDGFPIYTEYIVHEMKEDNDSLISLIHQIAVSRCMYYLSKWGLDYIFSAEDDLYIEKTFQDCGSFESIIAEISLEQNIQFDSRKMEVLKALQSFIEYEKRHAQKNVSKLNNEYSIFGTNNFDMLWQRACEVAFSDVYKTPIIELYDKGLLDNKPINDSDSISSTVEHPIWTIERKKQRADESLELDCVSIERTHKVDYLAIIDAKYYMIDVDKPSIGAPGVGDIIKQYAYQMAVDKFIKDQASQCFRINNYFVMPSESNKVIKGNASLKFFEKIANVNTIEVRLVPAKDILQCYILNSHLELSYLR